MKGLSNRKKDMNGSDVEVNRDMNVEMAKRWRGMDRMRQGGGEIQTE